MLSPNDAELVRRDGCLPGLATLLDSAAFVRALGKLLPEATIPARIAYIRYKPRNSCVVSYQVETPRGVVTLCAKTAPEKRAGPGPAPRSSNGGSDQAILADGAITASVFPSDHKLKALRRVNDEEQRRRMLEKLVPDHPNLWDVALTRLRYLPERRYVARLSTGATPVAVLKVYGETDYTIARQTQNAFRSDPPLVVGLCLGQSDRRRLLLHEWMPGRLLSEGLANPSLASGVMESVGMALALLHAQFPPGLTPRTFEIEAARLFALSANLGFTFPKLARRFFELTKHLVLHLDRTPQLSQPIHGDFSPSQVVLDGNQVAILDFDRAGLGDPAVDFGSFLAYLEREALRGTLRASRVELMKQDFIRGYRSVTRGPSPPTIQLHTAIALLRLAAHPFRHREPGWSAQTESILARAEAAAGGRGMAHG